MRVRLLAIAAFAGAALALARPLVAQVPDTAAIIERVRQELEAGRIGPEEVRARIRAAGISEDEVRRRLRELGYPESLLDQYLVGEAAPAGAVALTPAQVEQVLRRLSIPPLGEVGLADTLPAPPVRRPRGRVSGSSVGACSSGRPRSSAR